MSTGNQDKQGKAAASIPRGIEVLVKKASVDPAFRAILLERRAKAADEIGLTLTPAEAAMLDSIPAEQLQAIIDKTKVDPAHREVFRGKVAALMLAALTTGLVLSICLPSLGNRPGNIVEGVRPEHPTTAATAPTEPGTQPEKDDPRKDGP